ncbi:MAG: cobalamin biosynthesis protein [Acidimicrobiales bacterium]
MSGARATGLVFGWAADAAFGDPARFHPVAGFGRLATAAERIGYRPSRFAGFAHVVTLVAPTALAAAAADAATRRRSWSRTAVTGVLMWTVLGGRSLGVVAGRLADALAANDIPAARRIGPALVGRDPAHLDSSELCRAAVESVAENTADAVVGPLLWCAIAGPAGAVAYRAINTLDAMIGHRSDRYQRFGWGAARLDDVVTWPAARLAAGLAVALAPTVDGNRIRTWRVLRRDGARHPSPNAGRLEAAFAGALDIRLGGTNRYGEQVEHRPQLGDGSRPDVADVRRAVELSWLIGGVAALLCAIVARLRERRT